MKAETSFVADVLAQEGRSDARFCRSVSDVLPVLEALRDAPIGWKFWRGIVKPGLSLAITVLSAWRDETCGPPDGGQVVKLPEAA